MPNVIGVTGYKRSGKDTFTKALVEEFGLVRAAYGDFIRIELAELLGVDVKTIEKFKEPYYRRPLQDLAMKRRNEDPGYWIHRLEVHVRNLLKSSQATVIVSDLRLPNEEHSLRREFGAAIVRTVRQGQRNTDDHPTEERVDSIRPDFVYPASTHAEVESNALLFGERMGWGDGI